MSGEMSQGCTVHVLPVLCLTHRRDSSRYRWRYLPLCTPLGPRGYRLTPLSRHRVGVLKVSSDDEVCILQSSLQTTLYPECELVSDAKHGTPQSLVLREAWALALAMAWTCQEMSGYQVYSSHHILLCCAGCQRQGSGECQADRAARHPGGQPCTAA